MNEQLSLFTIHPVQVSKPKIDPYWDEITEPILKVGDWVKLSPQWMKNQADATTGNYKADYQFKSEDDLICKVIWVDPRNNGHISVDRNGHGLFIPAGCYTRVDDDSVIAFNSNLDNEFPSKDLVNSVVPSLFTGENVRPQDTQNLTIAPNNPGLDVVTGAGEHKPDSQEKFAGEHIHWVQEYWVRRGNKKHYYYRYCWMVGRKKKGVHLGSVSSPAAQAKREEIEIAIALGKSPADIKQLLKPQS